MSQTITVTYDSEKMELHMNEDDGDIHVKKGEIIEWVFLNMPPHCSPNILFNLDDDHENPNPHYYGPFDYLTQQIPGLDGDATRVFGRVLHDEFRDYEYRPIFQKGMFEDPFAEPYGNSPDSVGKAVLVGKRGYLRKQCNEQVHDPIKKEWYEDRIIKALLQMPRPGKPQWKEEFKVVPITEHGVGEDVALKIHDDWDPVPRIHSDTVIWDFRLTRDFAGWYPRLDFIGGEGMLYEDIENMHFGPFSSLTYATGHVIGTGRGRVPGSYHYRVAMIGERHGMLGFKSSPDPEVDYDDAGTGN